MTNEFKAGVASAVLLLTIIMLGAWVWEGALKRSPAHFQPMHEFHRNHSIPI